MKVTLNVTRVKKGEEIYEVFTIHPIKYSLLHDDSRAIVLEIWKARNDISLHKFFPMSDIQYYNDKIIYIYKYIELDNIKSIPMLDKMEIVYSPMLGKKSCKNCRHKKDNACVHRNKKMDMILYKCLYWKEKEGTIGTHALHNGKRPRRD